MAHRLASPWIFKWQLSIYQMGKAMTLSSGKSLESSKAMAFCHVGICCFCEQKGHQGKDSAGEKKDGGAPYEKSKFKTKEDFWIVNSWLVGSLPVRRNNVLIMLIAIWSLW